MLSINTMYESRMRAREVPSSTVTATKTGEAVARSERPGKAAGGRLKYWRAWAPVGSPQAICLMIPESGSVIMGLVWQ